MKMEEWKEYELSELIDEISMGPFGSNIKVECFTDSGVPVLNGSNLVGLKLNEDKFNYVTEEKASSLGKANAYRNDIVITHRGTLGQIVYIPQNSKYDHYVISQSQFRVRCNQKVLPEYLVYYFHTRIGQHQLLSNASQVGVPALARPTTTFQKLRVVLPPLPTQQKIAAILSSLDDKIELNNKINTNLEQQAGALFKNWFVDFEPFGGKMPEGWKVGTIGDLCSTISKTYKSNDSHVVLINTSDVENGTILNHNSVPNSKLKGQFKKTFQQGDILYSEIRPANKHYAFVDIKTTSNYIASTKLMVIRPNEGINPHYLYHILTNPDLIQEMQHLAETRSGTFPQITFESELSTYQIPLLPKEEQDKLGELFKKIDNQIFHNIEENKQLSTIRDTLLPKLMSSELDVKFVKI